MILTPRFWGEVLIISYLETSERFTGFDKLLVVVVVVVVDEAEKQKEEQDEVL